MLFPNVNESDQIEIVSPSAVASSLVSAWLERGKPGIARLVENGDNLNRLDEYLGQIHLGAYREWAGGISSQDSLRMFSAPRADLIAAVEEARSLISEDMVPPPTMRRRVRRGVETGETIDSDRYLARVAECWDRSERLPSAIRTIRLGINLATDSSRSESSIRWRGASAVAACDELTRRGFGVEIVAVSVSRRLYERFPHRRIFVGSTIKRASDPMDLAMLATFCCSIACFRHHYIPLLFASAAEEARYCAGYPEDTSANEVSCDALFDQSIATRDQAVAAVRRIVESLSGEPATAAD